MIDPPPAGRKQAPPMAAPPSSVNDRPLRASAAPSLARPFPSRGQGSRGQGSRGQGSTGCPSLATAFPELGVADRLQLHCAHGIGHASLRSTLQTCCSHSFGSRGQGSSTRQTCCSHSFGSRGQGSTALAPHVVQCLCTGARRRGPIMWPLPARLCAALPHRLLLDFCSSTCMRACVYTHAAPSSPQAVLLVHMHSTMYMHTVYMRTCTMPTRHMHMHTVHMLCMH